MHHKTHIESKDLPTVADIVAGSLRQISFSAAVTSGPTWNEAWAMMPKIRSRANSGELHIQINRVLRLPQKYIHPRFFIYSSKVCIIVQPIAILVQ